MFIRTDFTDGRAWQEVCDAARGPVARGLPGQSGVRTAWKIERLTISNMDGEDFDSCVDADGVFRGF
jgi:hypothetical protein